MSIRIFSLIFTAGISLAVMPAFAQVALETNDIVLGISADFEGGTRITTFSTKPATFDTYMDRMDYLHDNLQLSIQRHVSDVDTMMVDGSFEAVETPPSRFRLTPYITLKADDGLKVELDPDFDLEVELPNLEKRWKVFVESSRNDDLPGIDPNEKDQSGQIGIRREFKYFNTDAGVKFRWPPVAFFRVEWRPKWSVEHTVLQPKARLFYETDKGFGTLESFTIHRWFGEEKNMFWQSVSALKYDTKETEGVELEQTLKLGLVTQSLEPKFSWKRVLGTEDMAKGHQLRYSVFGNAESGDTSINRHRLTYTYRKPLYKKWIYLEMAPGVEAANDDDWQVIPVFTVGIDMLFWGTYER